MTDKTRTAEQLRTALYPPLTRQVDFHLAEEVVQIEAPGATGAPLPRLVPLASSPQVVEFSAHGPDRETTSPVDDATGRVSPSPDPGTSLPRRLELRDVELAVASFASFREVGRFQQALASLPDIGRVQVRHLHRGTLQVRVQCQGTTALLDALAVAYPRPFTVVSREPYRIEITLAEEESLPSQA